MAVALLLAAMALAGCTDSEPADFSRERLVISIADLGDGFELGLPLWLGPGGATANDWLDAAVIHAGTGNLSIRMVEQGQALWISGEGPIRIDIEDLLSSGTGAEAEAFTGGSYSLGVGGNGRPRLVIESGDVDITWQYEGVSKDCALFLNHGWTNRQTGVHVAEYGARPDPSHDCIR